ncbi:hypothetical protein ACFWVK_17990, partial [Streptomyces sp. NPDC058667]
PRRGRLPTPPPPPTPTARAMCRPPAPPRSAGDGEPAIVTVEAVVLTARERYGYAVVERQHAAAALRRRFEHRRCAVDCVTDAYG